MFRSIWATGEGERGPIGVQGPVGAAPTIRGTLDLESDLDDIVDQVLGDAWIIGTDLYVWDGLNWNNVGTIVGPQGPQGDTGPAGVGLVSGGSTGQFLRKVSGADYDTSWQTVDQSTVGLSEVDNTADLDKPISTAVQAELDNRLQAGTILSNGVGTGFILDDSVGEKTLDGGIVCALTGPSATHTTNYAAGTPTTTTDPVLRRVVTGSCVDPAWWSGARAFHAAVRFARLNGMICEFSGTWSLSTFVSLDSYVHIRGRAGAKLQSASGFVGGGILVYNGTTPIQNIRLTNLEISDPIGDAARVAHIYLALSATNLGWITDVILQDCRVNTIATGKCLFFDMVDGLRIEGGEYYTGQRLGAAPAINWFRAKNVSIKDAIIRDSGEGVYSHYLTKGLKVRNCQIYQIGNYRGEITATISIASPGVITTSRAHGYVAGTVIRFYTTGALPTGLSTGTDYYVISTGLTATAFQVSATLGGTAINTSGSQSGVHTVADLQGRGDGIHIGFNSAETEATLQGNDDISVVDNLIYKIGRSGTSMFGAINVQHHRNHVYYCGDTGLNAQPDEDGKWSTAAYTDNVVKYCRDFGIAHTAVTVSPATTVNVESVIMHGNDCTDNGKNPDAPSDVQLSHVPTKCGQMGVWGSVGTIWKHIDMSDNVLVGRDFTSNPQAIRIGQQTGAGTFEQIIVHDNFVEGYATRPLLLEANVTKLSVRGNRPSGTRVVLDTTVAKPSVSLFNEFEVGASATVIDGFSDAVEGQEILLYWTGDRTLTDSATLDLTTASFAGTSGAIMQLKVLGGVPREVSRRAA